MQAEKTLHVTRFWITAMPRHAISGLTQQPAWIAFAFTTSVAITRKSSILGALALAPLTSLLINAPDSDTARRSRDTARRRRTHTGSTTGGEKEVEPGTLTHRSSSMLRAPVVIGVFPPTHCRRSRPGTLRAKCAMHCKPRVSSSVNTTCKMSDRLIVTYVKHEFTRMPNNC